MKKALLIFVLLLSLCGCEKRGPEYLVSSIGFDKVKEDYCVYFESVIINSEDTKQSVKLLSGTGKTLSIAVDEIRKQCTQPLLLSHCGVFVLGDGITDKEVEYIGKYCVKNDEITLSAFFVKTENAKKLLSIKPVSSVSVGFDIMGLLEQNKRYKNRLFELVNSNYKSVLPKISLKDGGLMFGGK